MTSKRRAKKNLARTQRRHAFARAQYNTEIERINALSKAELHALLLAGTCPVPTHLLQGVPLGMYHCELCGTMVVAGAPHPPMDSILVQQLRDSLIPHTGMETNGGEVNQQVQVPAFTEENYE